jgi:hypothetical protein
VLLPGQQQAAFAAAELLEAGFADFIPSAGGLQALETLPTQISDLLLRSNVRHWVIHDKNTHNKSINDAPESVAKLKSR